VLSVVPAQNASRKAGEFSAAEPCGCLLPRLYQALLTNKNVAILPIVTVSAGRAHEISAARLRQSSGNVGLHIHSPHTSWSRSAKSLSTGTTLTFTVQNS
jgi:hypothetical protein